MVTGASSGLGQRIARVLHGVGARVVVTARRMDRLQQLVADLPDGVAIQADLSTGADRERAVREALDACGRIDVLVNNAGITVAAPVEEEELEDFQSVLEVNAVAPWHLAKLCAPSMINNGGGSIINVASILGMVGGTPIRQAGYCSSKGAVINLSRELALQWARKGIRVNALCPGWFPSELTADMVADPSSQRFIARNSPIPRMGYEHELDGAVLLLATDASTFITGQTIVVDGGWTAR